MAVARRTLQGALLAGMMLAVTAHAQQLPAPPAETTAQTTPAPSPAQDSVTTLGEVRALKPEDDQPLDLYRFKNPVKFGDNRFSRDWQEPPTPEQVSLGVLAAGRGLNQLTGGPDQIQSAIARPPPELSADQQRRALQFCQQQDGCGAPPQD